MKLYGTQGEYQLPDKPLAQGGEGAIYTVENKTDLVAKVYHQEKLSSDPELENKIKYMVNNTPNKSVLNQIAWPLDILYDGSRRFIGFTMPKLNTDTDLKTIYPYPPKKELPISNEQKLIVAINICIVISEIHKAGYIFGDFNPMNIGVNLTTGHVAFYDTDSYHFTDPNTGHTYRCGVGADGYIAPELIQHCHDCKADFLNAPLPTFTRETDEFALGIHIFKLLMNGYTPFNGIKECESASQSSPGTGNIAIERDNYCFKPGNKPQSPATPDLSSLTPDIQFLFKKTFLGGNKDPQSRATPEEWKDALIEYKNEMKQCANNPLHHYYVNNSSCPYCEADKRYQQSISQASQTYKTGTSGSSQFGFSNPINVPPSSSNQTSNQYQQPNKTQKTRNQIILRVLLWVFFWPIMLSIKIYKTKWHGLVKAIAIYMVISMGFNIYGGALAGVVGILSLGSGDGNSAFSSNTVIDGDYMFTKEGDSYTISVAPKRVSNIKGEIEIPSSHKGIPVTKISEYAFENCSNITSVVIPDSVVSIGKGAFKGCDSIESITLPFIGTSEDATKNKALFGNIFGEEVIRKNNEYISYDDTALNKSPVEIPGETWQYTWQEYGGIVSDTYTEYYYYYIPDSLSEVIVTKQRNIPDYAFNGCKNIEKITYLANAKAGDKLTIGEAAFQDCHKLIFDDTLYIGDEYMSIGDYAYKNCYNIKSVEISSYVRYIGYGAFNGCNQIEKITLPFIGTAEDATKNNAVFGNIFGGEVVQKGEYISTKDTALNKKPIEIPGETWQYTWQEYGGLGSDTYTNYYYYYIPDSLTEVEVTKQAKIPDYGFNGCKNLVSIGLPNGYTLGEFSLQDCPAIITESTN